MSERRKKTKTKGINSNLQINNKIISTPKKKNKNLSKNFELINNMFIKHAENSYCNLSTIIFYEIFLKIDTYDLTLNVNLL
jgi:hypothetical protein